MGWIQMDSSICIEYGVSVVASGVVFCTLCGIFLHFLAKYTWGLSGALLHDLIGMDWGINSITMYLEQNND